MYIFMNWYFRSNKKKFEQRTEEMIKDYILYGERPKEVSK